jgi:hypothetical protein
MELVGTVTLPACILFTIYLIIDIAIPDANKPFPYIPLTLLVSLLGLPGILMVFLSMRIQNVFWMIIYLLALPIWNFVLPLYAFWHFDDFSWGETRKTQNDKKGEDHGRREGEFDASGINMKRWSEWMQYRRVMLEQRSGYLGNTMRSGSGSSLLLQPHHPQIHQQQMIMNGNGVRPTTTVLVQPLPRAITPPVPQLPPQHFIMSSASPVVPMVINQQQVVTHSQGVPQHGQGVPQGIQSVQGVPVIYVQPPARS